MSENHHAARLLAALAGVALLFGCTPPCGDGATCANACPVAQQLECTTSCHDTGTYAGCGTCPSGYIDRATCPRDGGTDASRG